MLSQSRFRLTIRQGPAPGKVFELAKDTLTIGRDVSADVTINDAEVSRTHTKLTAQADGYLVEDLGSTNGTFINGQRVTGSKLLRPGDTLGLGETVVLELSRVAEASAATVVMPQKSMPMPSAASAPSTASMPPPSSSPSPAMESTLSGSEPITPAKSSSPLRWV